MWDRDCTVPPSTEPAIKELWLEQIDVGPTAVRTGCCWDRFECDIFGSLGGKIGGHLFGALLFQ